MRLQVQPELGFHAEANAQARGRALNPVDPPMAEAYPEATRNVPGEDGNKLIVGPNIKLKGPEIIDCEILVVEGRVKASMNSRDIRIAEGGVFSGKAEVDVRAVGFAVRCLTRSPTPAH